MFLGLHVLGGGVAIAGVKLAPIVGVGGAPADRRVSWQGAAK